MAAEALKYLAKGQGHALEPTPVAKPKIIEPSEIMIRLKAIAINPADYKMVDHGHRVMTWPFVPGLDGAGLVEEVGGGVTNFVPGERVLALFTPGDRAASFQSYAVVKDKDVAKIPASWTFEEAATLGVCYLTGILALGIGLNIPLSFLEGGETAGFRPSSVLILGGSSAVGAATIRLLHLAVPGCKILATSSPKHHTYLKDVLGVHSVINRASLSLADDVKAHTLGFLGVDSIIDAVGAGSLHKEVFEALDINGPKKYAQVWTGDEEIAAPSDVKSVLFRGRDLPSLRGNEGVVKTLEVLLEQGKYGLPLPVKIVGQGFDLLQKGLDMMRQGVSGEKLVVTV